MTTTKRAPALAVISTILPSQKLQAEIDDVDRRARAISDRRPGLTKDLTTVKAAIGLLRARGHDAADLQSQARELSDSLEADELALKELDTERTELTKRLLAAQVSEAKAEAERLSDAARTALAELVSTFDTFVLDLEKRAGSVLGALHAGESAHQHVDQLEGRPQSWQTRTPELPRTIRATLDAVNDERMRADTDARFVAAGIR